MISMICIVTPPYFFQYIIVHGIQIIIKRKPVILIYFVQKLLFFLVSCLCWILIYIFTSVSTIEYIMSTEKSIFVLRVVTNFCSKGEVKTAGRSDMFLICLEQTSPLIFRMFTLNCSHQQDDDFLGMSLMFVGLHFWISFTIWRCLFTFFVASLGAGTF